MSYQTLVVIAVISVIKKSKYKIMKLIDKDAVLAEIKELSSAIKIQLDYKKGDAFWIAQKLLLERLKGKINSLKVKEVDLEKELTEWHKKHFSKKDTFNGKSGFYLTNSSQLDIAKHFFELGVNASNPLTWEDISSLKLLIDEVENEFKKGLHNDKSYAGYCEEVLKRFKAQKGEKI